MMYYPPENPNYALTAHRREQPVLRGIRIALIVLVSLLLVFSLLLTTVSGSIRLKITPEYVYQYMAQVEYTDFPLPMDGTYQTISQLMLEAFNGVGFNLTEADIKLLFDQFSIPTILAGFAQDMTAWLLYDGPRPVLDPQTIAETALSGVDDSILAVLYFLGDPVALVSQILTTPLSRLETDGLLDALEPVRTLLSVHVSALLASSAAMLALLLFCLCRCRFLPFSLPAGISLLMTSGFLTLMNLLQPLWIHRFTVVYASYFQSFLSAVNASLYRAALVCGILGLVLLTVWILSCLYTGKQSSRPAEL